MADVNEAASMAENNGEKIESTTKVAIAETSWDTIADSKRSDAKKAQAKKQSLLSMLSSALSLSKNIHFEYIISNFIRRVRGIIPRLAAAATRNVPPATLSKTFQLRIEGNIKLKLKGRLLIIWLLLLHREGKEALKESRWRVILFFASCLVVSCMYFHAASFSLDPKVTDHLFSLHGIPKYRSTAGVGLFLNVYMAHP